MPFDTTPGVYIDEQVATGPIQGVGTSVAGFLGAAPTGDIATPAEITNLTVFTAKFVKPDHQPTEAEGDLVRGVRGFFENGGTVAWVTRVGLTGVTAAVGLPGDGVAHDVLTVTARRPGVEGNDIAVTVQRPDPPADPAQPGPDAHRFTLVVTGPNENQTQTFAGLSMDPTDPKYVGSQLAGAVVDVTPTDAAERTPPAAVEEEPLTDGADPGPADDDAAWRAALAALGKVDEVSIVCAPGVTAPGVQRLLVEHCETAQDRFAILDAPRSATMDAVKVHRGQVGSPKGYAALYHPWLTIAHPVRPDTTLAVPPSGHVAGVLARVDTQRGVHKAPANELVNGVLGLEQTLDDAQQGVLNPRGINVLRVFPGRARPVIWGARTTSDDTAWRYVNVRRLFLFIEESIQEGIRWAVFEPNDRSLWKRLDRTITEFLTRVWSAGALFGAKSAEAFYVKIDDENNPDPELGQVFIEVGVAPVRPAEFVVVRIGIWAGGGQVQEG